MLLRASSALAIALFACTPSAMSIDSDHPANANAPAGRLAGPPAALRPDVADAAGVQEPTNGHEHREQGSAAPPAPTGHEGHDQAPAQEKQQEPKPLVKPKQPVKKQPRNPEPPKQPPAQGHH